MIVRLKHGFLDTCVVNVPSDTKWIFIELSKPGVEISKVEKKIPLMQLAAWPDDDAPVGRPPGFTGPMVCYRLLNINVIQTKAEFEYDEKYSDEIEIEYEHPTG